MRTIRFFLLTQMPETAEADEDELDANQSKEPIAKVYSPWASLESTNASLQQDKLTEGNKQHKHRMAMDAAKDLTHLIWGFDESDNPGPVCKDGNIATYTVSKSSPSKISTAPTVPAPGNSFQPDVPSYGNVAVLYKGLTPQKAHKWFKILCTQGLPKDTRRPCPIPNAEQQKIISAIIQRCLDELKDENGDMDLMKEKTGTNN